VLLAQPNAAALDLRRARPEVPGAIAQLVQRMLADAVDVRPRPQQIHQVMHHWLRELPRDDAQARPLRREGAAPPPRETLPGAPKPLRARPQEPQERPQERPQETPPAPPRLMVLRVSSADAGAWRGALEAAQSALSGGMAVELYLDPVALRGLARAGAEGARAAWAVRRHGALWARPSARPRQDGALRARLAALLEGGARAFALADAPLTPLPPGIATAPPSRWTERAAEATVHLIFAR
jgi:hypothetical protein